MKILFKTFGEGHLVSNKEFDKLKSGFAKNGMELVRNADDYDIVMVKGFSHKWNEIPHNKPVVYYSIGTEWKAGINIEEANEPIRELYQNADIVVHISDYCKKITERVFGIRDKQYVIIPANPVNLPKEYPYNLNIKVAITCIPRPVKRLEETMEALEKLKKELPLEIMLATGGTSDFSYYHDCDIYVHLSRKEGMPNTVLEAMSYGLPCLVTNHGGAKEAVGNSGVVLQNDPGDDFMPDLSNIEPINYPAFREAFFKIYENINNYRKLVRHRVLYELNDEITGKQFKKVFETL